MIEEIMKEIESIIESAQRIAKLGKENPSIEKNAQIILIFAQLLEFITPLTNKEVK